MQQSLLHAQGLFAQLSVGVFAMMFEATAERRGKDRVAEHGNHAVEWIGQSLARRDEMSIWTVMFGDDPLKKSADGACISTRVKIFNSRRKAYGFRDFCKVQGLYADVVFHPHRPAYATLH